MPYPNFHSARVKDPDTFIPDSFRYKNIVDGIDIIIGKPKDGSNSMVTQAYRFDKEKYTVEQAKMWLKDHNIDYISFEGATNIHSTLTEKPKIDNGIWIPFLKDGQLAEDNEGRQYILTKEAIDSGYKSYIGGFININHQDKINGHIKDVRRRGEYADFTPEGLDEEALAVVNSPAYRGVSQQSVNLYASAKPEPDGKIKVQSLNGKGVAIALYPKAPGCPISAGCGIPLNSITSEGTMQYNREQIKEMLKAMKDHPGMMDQEMIDMMEEMIGEYQMKSTMLPSVKANMPQEVIDLYEKAFTEAKSGACKDKTGFESVTCPEKAAWDAVKAKFDKGTDGKWVLKSSISDFSLNNQNLNSSIKSTGGTNTNMPDGTDSADALKSITMERDALKSKVEALTAEMNSLKSTVTEPQKRIAELQKALDSKDDAMALTIKSRLESTVAEFRNEMSEKEEYEKVVKELRSIMPRQVLDELITKKTPLAELKSNLRILQLSGLTPRAGASIGELTSTQEQKYVKTMEELHIPSIEFTNGRN